MTWSRWCAARHDETEPWRAGFSGWEPPWCPRRRLGVVRVCDFHRRICEALRAARDVRGPSICGRNAGGLRPTPEAARAGCNARRLILIFRWRNARSRRFRPRSIADGTEACATLPWTTASSPRCSAGALTTARPPAATPVKVRERIDEALRLDLVGPGSGPEPDGPGVDLAEELLPGQVRPSNW